MFIFNTSTHEFTTILCLLRFLMTVDVAGLFARGELIRAICRLLWLRRWIPVIAAAIIKRYNPSVTFVGANGHNVFEYNLC